MAANSDMSSPIDATVNDVLNGFSQSCTSQLEAQTVLAQTSEARKRLPAKKSDTQSSVKLSLQLPKNVAVRLKRVAEKVPSTLLDFGLLSVHFLGERTIQLASTLQSKTATESDVRQSDSSWPPIANGNRRTSESEERYAGSNGCASEETCSRRSSNDTTVFLVPTTSSSSPSGEPTLSNTNSPLSVALVTSNGLKLRVRTAQLATSTSLPTGTLDCDTTVNCTDRNTSRSVTQNGHDDSDCHVRNGVHVHELDSLNNLQRVARSKRTLDCVPSNEAGGFTAVSVNGKRAKNDCDDGANHHAHAPLALNVHGVLQNGRNRGELDTSCGSPQLALRSSKALNGVRCVTPRAVHAVTSATASELG